MIILISWKARTTDSDPMPCPQVGVWHVALLWTTLRADRVGGYGFSLGSCCSMNAHGALTCHPSTSSGTWSSTCGSSTSSSAASCASSTSRCACPGEPPETARPPQSLRLLINGHGGLHVALRILQPSVGSRAELVLSGSTHCP